MRAFLVRLWWVACLLGMAGVAKGQTHTYDFIWYSGASQPWVYDTGQRLTLEVYEDPSTPENDVFFRLRNGLDVPLTHNGQVLDHSLSCICDLQFDTGTQHPDMFTSLSIWESVGDMRIQMNAVGVPPTLMDQSGSTSRLAWAADYAAGRESTARPKTEGVNAGEYIVLRAILKPGLTFAEVIAALDQGVSSTYVAGHYGLWTTAQKLGYRAEAPKGLRVALLMQSIVPNTWNPEGHGLFVTHRRVEALTAPQIASVAATPSSITDAQISNLSVVAYDPQPGPQLLSYLWSVVNGGGSVGSATSATAVYTPPEVSAARTVVVRVAVSDGDSTVTRDLTIDISDADAPPPNVPPAIVAVTATPSTIWDSQQSQLSVTATDSDGPAALTYAWEVVSGGGMFDSATSRNPWYAPADVIGTQTVTLRVTVSDGAASTTGEVTLTVQDASPPPPGTQILSQDFTAGSFAGWSFVDEGTISAPSKWRIVSGELAQQSNIRDGGRTDDLPRLGTYLLYNDGLGWTDYKARFRMRSTDDDGLGMMFRYIDQDNWYRFSWDRQLQQRRLVKKAAGVYTLLAADNVPYALGQSYEVEIVAQGSQLEVWVGGVRVFQVEDTAHRRGSVAFYSWQNNGAFFDNLVVEDLSGGNFNVLPKITALTATPSTVLDNQTSQLSVTATDVDGPDPLSYRWTIVSGGGVISGATSATPIYVPVDVVGTQTVKIKVEVDDGAATVTGNLTLRVEDSTPPPLGPLLLEGDFGGTLAGWSVVDEGTISAPSRWRIASGELAQLSNIRDGGRADSLPKQGTYLAYDGGAAWTDYRARFKLRSVDDDTVGLMFRVTDADNHYRFSWNKQLSERQLVKKVGGVYTLLAADNEPYVVGQRYDVEIIASGSLLEVWVDGARVFEVTDTGVSGGSVAFYTWQHNGAYFDDIQVNAIE